MLPLLLQLRVVWASARARCYEADPSASPQVGTSPPAGWGQSSAPCDAAIPEWDWVWDEVLSGVPSLRGAANRSAALVRGDHVRFATLADHALYAVRKPRTGNRPGALENKPNVDIVHGLPQVLDPAGIAARSHARVMLCLSPAHRLLPPPPVLPKTGARGALDPDGRRGEARAPRHRPPRLRRPRRPAPSLRRVRRRESGLPPLAPGKTTHERKIISASTGSNLISAACCRGCTNAQMNRE